MGCNWSGAASAYLLSAWHRIEFKLIMFKSASLLYGTELSLGNNIEIRRNDNGSWAAQPSFRNLSQKQASQMTGIIKL
jgi:hypothetical protein